MYWSIYDTFLLLSGLITVAIAIIPIPTIPAKTRVTSGAVGGGIVLLSLVLGNMPSFTYPAIVMGAPLIALLVVGVVVKSALDLKKNQDAATSDPHHGYLQDGQQGHSVTPVARQQHAAPQEYASVVAPPRPPDPVQPHGDPRRAAWAELHDPATPAARLPEIAAAHPEFAATIAAHPNAYPELRAWATAVAAGGS